MELTLLLLIIPVVGSIAGLIGKSWDDTKPSWIKLTTRGWVSLSIILIGLTLGAIKTIQTQRENDKLKDQTSRVRALVYDKLYYDCVRIIQPIMTLYLEQSKRQLREADAEDALCQEMAHDSTQHYFANCNLLDSVQAGTAFEEWDRSYLDYFTGYYKTNSPYGLEKTQERWANYIDLDDILLIDTIVNHSYWVNLSNMNFGQSYEELKKGRIYYYFDYDDDILQEQKDFLLHIGLLIAKSKLCSNRQISFSSSVAPRVQRPSLLREN